MLTFKEYLEAHHSYDDPDNAKFAPINKGDTLRVFHGFHEVKDAYEAAIYGLTGKDRAQRRYSYESDNNPHGLFVTLSFKQAQYFTNDIIMEFVAKREDLEAPVWPGGSYTVQGQMAQYFGHGREGRLKRNRRRIEAEKETENRIAKRDDLDHVKQSDSKYLANMLTNTTEYQALFIGDLNPEHIIGFWVKEDPSLNNHYAKWKKITREEFIEQNNAEFAQNKGDVKAKYRAMKPADKFDPDKFLDGMMKRLRKPPEEKESLIENLKRIWKNIKESENPMRTFIYYFDNYLWVGQYKDAFLWMKKNF